MFRVLVLTFVLFSATTFARDISHAEATSFIQSWYQNWDLATDHDDARDWLVNHISTGPDVLMTFRAPVRSQTDLAGFLSQLRAGQVSSIHELNVLEKTGESTFKFVVTFLSHSAAAGVDFNGTTLIEVKLDGEGPALLISRYIVRVMAPVTENPSLGLQGQVLNADVEL